MTTTTAPDAPIPADLAVDVVPFDPESLDQFLALIEAFGGSPGRVTAAFDEDDTDGALNHVADRPEGWAESSHLEPIARWSITDEGAAEWAMRHLADAEARAAHVRAQAEAWRVRIDDWETEALAQPTGRAEFFTGHLAAYMATQRTDRVKSIALPSGRLESRGSTEPKVVVLDEDKVVAWAEETLPTDTYGEVVKTTTKVLLAPFRALVRIVTQEPADDAPEGAMPTRTVVDGNGVEVPGVSIEDPAVSYSVKAR